jgi:lysozyme family protein
MTRVPLTAFDRALAWLLQQEGGFSADPSDRAARMVPPGQVHTAYGITQVTYTAWLEKQGESHRPVGAITMAEVASIYLGIWRRVGCADLAEDGAHRLALVHFDGAVQHGERSAVRLLQRSVQVVPDGIWGPRTHAAVRAAMACHQPPNDGPLCEAVLARRVALYQRLLRLPGQIRFARGWRRRINALATHVGVPIPWPDSPSSPSSPSLA